MSAYKYLQWSFPQVCPLEAMLMVVLLRPLQITKNTFGHTINIDKERSKTARLKVADDTTHVPTGIGCLKVPCSQAGMHKFVRTYCTPEIPATILSPDAMGQEMDCQGYQTCSDF